MKKLLIAGALILGIIGCASTPHKTSVKIYIQQRNWAKALKEAKAWVQEAPNDPEAYYWLAMAYTGMQKYDSAADNLIKAIDLDKNGVLKDKIGTNEVNILLTAGKNTYSQDKDRALKYFEYALKLSPNNKAALLSVATIFIQEGKFKEAEEYVNKAKKIDEKNPLVYSYLATIYDSLANRNPDKKMEYLRRAEENLKKTVELKPTAENYASLASFYLSYRNEDSAFANLAEENFKKAIEKDTANENLYFNYGMAAFINKHYKVAAKAFEKFLKFEPNDETALEYYGLSLYSYGQKLEDSGKKSMAKDLYRKAVEVYEKLVQLNPNNPDYYQMLSVCYLKVGDTKKAQKAMKKYQALSKKGN